MAPPGRKRLLSARLWPSVFALSTWVGGTPYQMLVTVPLWSASNPESVRNFFQGTAYNRAVVHGAPQPSGRFCAGRRMACATTPVCLADHLGSLMGHGSNRQECGMSVHCRASLVG